MDAFVGEVTEMSGKKRVLPGQGYYEMELSQEGIMSCGGGYKLVVRQTDT